MGAVETEKLKSFRPFLRCMNNTDASLRLLFSEILLGNFLCALRELLRELAFDDLLSIVRKRTHVMDVFMRQRWYYGPRMIFFTHTGTEDLESIVDGR